MTGSLSSSAGFNFNDERISKLIEHVRFYLRDYEELNRLTDGVDHSDRHIYWAILDTVSDWASTPPFVVNGLSTILDRGWISIFLRGVVISLLEGLGLLHLRNFLSYSDGGINVQTENPQMLQAWLSMFKNEYEQKKQRTLVAYNIENAMNEGGVHSEYVFVNSFFGDW